MKPRFIVKWYRHGVVLASKQYRTFARAKEMAKDAHARTHAHEYIVIVGPGIPWLNISDQFDKEGV